MSGVAGAMAGTGGTTVVNNYNNDNSRTVNQTNHSPKSLSRTFAKQTAQFRKAKHAAGDLSYDTECAECVMGWAYACPNIPFCLALLYFLAHQTQRTLVDPNH